MAKAIDLTSSTQTGSVSRFTEESRSKLSADYSAQISSSIQEASRSGEIQHPGLSDLQKLINSVMIPLLTKVLEAGQELKNAPTRLSPPPATSVEATRDELASLGRDLDILDHWIVACRKQMEKVVHASSKPPTPTSLLEKRSSWLKRVLGG